MDELTSRDPAKTVRALFVLLQKEPPRVLGDVLGHPDWSFD